MQKTFWIVLKVLASILNLFTLGFILLTWRQVPQYPLIYLVLFTSIVVTLRSLTKARTKGLLAALATVVLLLLIGAIFLITSLSRTIPGLMM